MFPYATHLTRAMDCYGQASTDVIVPHASG